MKKLHQCGMVIGKECRQANTHTVLLQGMLSLSVSTHRSELHAPSQLNSSTQTNSVQGYRKASSLNRCKESVPPGNISSTIWITQAHSRICSRTCPLNCSTALFYAHKLTHPPTHKHTQAHPHPICSRTCPLSRSTALSYARAASFSLTKEPMKCCLPPPHTRTCAGALSKRC